MPKILNNSVKPDVSYSCQNLETDPATRQLWNRAALCQDLIRPAFWMGYTVVFFLDGQFGKRLGRADWLWYSYTLDSGDIWLEWLPFLYLLVLSMSTSRPRSVNFMHTWYLINSGISLPLLSFLPTPPCHCLAQCPGWLRVGSPERT